jgi:hypothetical protein
MSGLRHPEQRHPDATALAEYRAGLADGRRGRRLAAHVVSCARCASVSDQLAAVSSALSSVPAPPMPDLVERRITAALATEAAGLDSASAPTRPKRHVRLPRPALVASAVAACLVLFGVVFGLTRSPAGPASSAAGSSATSASSPLAGVAAPAASKPVFVVTASGTRYQPATLATQVRAQMAARYGGTNSAPANPGALQGAARPSGAAPGAVPSATLAGCVLHLTKQVPPSLVDRATYQGKPAYVIAVPDRVWVVGPDCTASSPDLITSTGL